MPGETRSCIGPRTRAIQKKDAGTEQVAGWKYVASSLKLAKCMLLEVPLALASAMISENLAASLLTRTLVHNGVVLQKLAQFLSTRPDILPGALVEKLETLQDRVPVRIKIRPEIEIEKELGVKLHKGAVEGQIGSGTVAQVFLVSLGGRKYAVKCIGPGVRESARTDLWVLGHMCRALGLGSYFKEFQEMMQKQLDLREEKRNTEAFRTNFRMYSSGQEENNLPSRIVQGLQYLGLWRKAAYIFPKPLAATRNILLTEYWPGQPVTRENRKNVLFMYLKMVFRDGFVHADLHPGNIRETEGKALVVYDTGLSHKLGEARRKNLVDLLKNLIAGDPEQAFGLVVSRNPLNKHKEKEKQAFASEASAVYREILAGKKGAALSALRMYVLARKHSVFLDECYTNIAMSTCYVQKLAGSAVGCLRSPWFFLGTGLFSEWIALSRKWGRNMQDQGAPSRSSRTVRT